MKDLTFIAEGNPDYLKGGLINLTKRRQVSQDTLIKSDLLISVHSGLRRVSTQKVEGFGWPSRVSFLLSKFSAKSIQFPPPHTGTSNAHIASFHFEP